MRTTKRNTKKQFRKKALIVSLTVVVFVALSGVAFAVLVPKDNTGHSDNKNSSTVDNSDIPTKDTDDKGAQPPENYTPPTTNDGIDLSSEKSGDTVIIRTALTGYSDGTCTLAITSGERSYTDTADVIFTPDQSLCAGFTVPIEKLGDGAWQITLKILSGGKLTSKTLTYEVSQ